MVPSHLGDAAEGRQMRPLAPRAKPASRRELVEEVTAGPPGPAASASIATSAEATNRLIEVQAQFNAYQMLQQRRPKLKFSGDTTKMDFEAHMRKFEVMTDVPGATDVMKLDELGHWFMGKADLVVGRFATSKDATQGLTDAKKALHEEFGRRRFTAKQLLDDLIVGDKYHEKEHGAIQTFLLQLEKVYHLAIETNWASTFNTREIYEEILRVKLPHLMSRWIC